MCVLSWHSGLTLFCAVCACVRTGSLSFEGFLEFCDECWSDAELIRVAKAIGVELRYRFDSEQHRVLRVFQQNGVNEDGEQIHHRREHDCWHSPHRIGTDTQAVCELTNSLL